mmetsp:Transcript_4172/g.16858  ORF Transcript_4172/g.16858 Transcript_4172/m.16858 type:complete len:256 (+) Transcript_4172:3-770(+)
MRAMLGYYLPDDFVGNWKWGRTVTACALPEHPTLLSRYAQTRSGRRDGADWDSCAYVAPRPRCRKNTVYLSNHEASKKAFPATTSSPRQPSDQTSALVASSDPTLGSHSSGARYGMVQCVLASSCSRSASRRVATATTAGPIEPKSISTGRPSSAMSTFSGLMSRCAKPAAWIARAPAHVPSNSRAKSARRHRSVSFSRDDGALPRSLSLKQKARTLALMASRSEPREHRGNARSARPLGVAVAESRSGMRFGWS